MKSDFDLMPLGKKCLQQCITKLIQYESFSMKWLFWTRWVLQNNNSVKSYPGNVQPMCTSTWAVISLDAYLAPYLQLYCPFCVKIIMFYCLLSKL